MPMTSHGPKHGSVPATELVRCASATDAIERLIELYEGAVAQIERDFDAFAKGDLRPRKHPVYPYLGVEVESVALPNASTLAFGKVSRPGFYGNTITAPRLFPRLSDRTARPSDCQCQGGYIRRQRAIPRFP